MEIDLPDVVREVCAAFESYERALVANDVATLDALFRNDPRTIRYGARSAGRCKPGPDSPRAGGWWPPT